MYQADTAAIKLCIMHPSKPFSGKNNFSHLSLTDLLVGYGSAGSVGLAGLDSRLWVGPDLLYNLLVLGLVASWDLIFSWWMADVQEIKLNPRDTVKAFAYVTSTNATGQSKSHGQD